MAYNPRYDTGPDEKSAEDLYEEELAKHRQFIENKMALDNQYYESQIAGLRRFRAEQEKLNKKNNEDILKQKELEEALKAAKEAAAAGVEGAADVAAGIQKEIDDLPKYFELKKKLEKKFQKDKQKTELEQLEELYEKKKKEALESGSKDLFGKDSTIQERIAGFKQMKEAADSTGELAGAIISGLANLAKALDNQIDKIAGLKTPVDTRLNGLSGSSRFGSHWDYYSNRIVGAVGVSPFVKQEQVVDKLIAYIDKGIAYNVDQRAFLGTISDQIATTFDAANGTLLQIVRIQQSDSTAARLGMEATLNSYLNSMYQTTEYLSDLAKPVTTALYEATSLMSSTQSIGFEYQVQKWLGSLYSVGMSQNSITGLASALGALGSGNLSQLYSTQYGTLLTMAASRAGLGMDDLLKKGLDESNTNKLLAAVVDYLASIASDNKVVQSSLASVFGVASSDIKAATNLASSIKNISGSNLDYGGAMNSLYNMADSMWKRNSLGNMLANVWENTKYSMSAGIANNPALYAIWKAAGLLEDTVGGINIPAISVMGNAVDLETTVAALMRVGALSGGILSSIGAMIAAGSGGGFSGSGMLNAFGLDKGAISVISRGTGAGITSSGASVSQSTFVGNSSGSDIYDSTMSGATDTKNQSMAEAKEDEENQVDMKTIDDHIIDINTTLTDIKDLIGRVIVGSEVNVKVSNYGITGFPNG